MKTSLEAYYQTLVVPVLPLLVKQEIEKLEIAINNAIRANTFFVSYNAIYIGNALIANAEGEIEPGVLTKDQKTFLSTLEASGYDISRDPLTGNWFVSWLNGNYTVPPSAAEARRVMGIDGVAFVTGDVKYTFRDTPASGWIQASDGTIGSPASGATRANEDCRDLYKLMWEVLPNSIATVSGGRGSNGSDDFDANKTLLLPKLLGRILGVAGSGAGLSVRDLGVSVGEETHVLTVDEIPEHDHDVPSQLQSGPDLSGGAGVYISASMINDGTSGSTGGGEAHNNMQPTTFMNLEIKL